MAMAVRMLVRELAEGQQRGDRGRGHEAGASDGQPEEEHGQDDQEQRPPRDPAEPPLSAGAGDELLPTMSRPRRTRMPPSAMQYRAPRGVPSS